MRDRAAYDIRPDDALVIVDVQHDFLPGGALGVAEGELVSVIGPNGAGKTTLFNLITGLEVPDSGSIVFAQQPITARGTSAAIKASLSAAESWLCPRPLHYLRCEVHVTLTLHSPPFESKDFLQIISIKALDSNNTIVL